MGISTGIPTPDQLLLFLYTISTAYHLLSGSRAARLLLNWLMDPDHDHYPEYHPDRSKLLIIYLFNIPKAMQRCNQTQ